MISMPGLRRPSPIDSRNVPAPSRGAFQLADLEQIFQSRFSSATRVQLLWKGRESFEAIFHAVEEAVGLIFLQFYIFRSDDTGRQLAELLKKKSLQGVMVYLLYDHFGSFGTPRRFWNGMKEAGIHIRASYPFKWRAPFRYVHRDHRKLIVIDSRLAFTGGVNIANEYSWIHLGRQKRGWRDTGIMLEGPIVEELSNTFRRSWKTWKGEKIAAPTSPRGEPAPSKIGVNIPALPIFVYSVKGRRRIRALLRYSINHARESILLTTAYFIPSRRFLAALEKAVRRGVDVRLLVPGRSDVRAASFAGRAFFTRLLKRGVKIYTYRGEMLHAKTYVFDRFWSIVGSTNLDYQSLMYNDEGNVGILDQGFGSRMSEVFEEDIKNSTSIQPGAWRRRPFFDKIMEHFFAMFRKRL